MLRNITIVWFMGGGSGALIRHGNFQVSQSSRQKWQFHLSHITTGPKPPPHGDETLSYPYLERSTGSLAQSFVGVDRSTLESRARTEKGDVVCRMDRLRPSVCTHSRTYITTEERYLLGLFGHPTNARAWTATTEWPCVSASSPRLMNALQHRSCRSCKNPTWKCRKLEELNAAIGKLSISYKRPKIPNRINPKD